MYIKNLTPRQSIRPGQRGEVTLEPMLSKDTLAVLKGCVMKSYISKIYI